MLGDKTLTIESERAQLEQAQRACTLKQLHDRIQRLERENTELREMLRGKAPAVCEPVSDDEWIERR